MIEKSLRHRLRSGVTANQGLVATGRQTSFQTFFQLLFCKCRVVVFFKCFKQGVAGVKSLDPHFTAGTLCRIASCSAAGLHEQCKQTFWRSEIAGEQSAIRVDGCHQSNAPKVMPFGNHLCANQHIHLTTVHPRQLGF